MFPARYSFLFSFLLLAACASSPVKGAAVAKSSAELHSALQTGTVSEIQFEGSITLDRQAWSTVVLNRSVLIYGEDRLRNTLDFNHVQEAIVLRGVRLEFRNLTVTGIPDTAATTLGRFSRYRVYDQYSWPCVISLSGATVAHNRSWIRSASIYSPAFYSGELAIYGIGYDFEATDGDSFLFHGFHALPSNVTDLLLDQDVGVAVIETFEVKVTPLTAQAEATTSSTTVIRDKHLIIGWQTVLIALALALALYIGTLAVLFLFRRRLMDRFAPTVIAVKPADFEVQCVAQRDGCKGEP